MLHEASDFYNKPQSNWHFLNFWTKRPISNPAYGHFKTGIFFVFWKKWAFSKRSFFEKIKKRAFPKRPFFENLISKRAFFKFSNGKKKQWPGKKKLVILAGDWKFRIKNQWFVTGTFGYVTGIISEIVTGTFHLSRAYFDLFCHGQLVQCHGQNSGFFVTGTFTKSRALFRQMSRANRKVSRGKK